MTDVFVPDRMTCRGVVLLTGASSGLGRACGAQLAQRGYRVFGASRRCPSDALPFESLYLDVSSDASVEAVIADVKKQAGSIDVLVNFAGISLAGAFEQHSPEEARSILDINALGTFRMCRAVLPEMRARGTGRIVNVTSLAGRVGMPYLSLYSASKFAVEGMTESLRLEVRRFGIAVSLLEPGDFLTEMTQSYARTEGSATDTVYAEDARRAIRIMEQDCRACPNLQLVALRLETILSSKEPALRYTVGMWPQRMAVYLHRLVPNSWFEAILRSMYRMG